MFYFYLGIFFLLIWFLRRFFNGPFYNKTKPNLAGYNIIITGCSAGIGKETAFDLLNQGARVIFACRDQAKTNAVINTIQSEENKKRAVFIKIDLTNVDSIINFNKELRTKFGEKEYIDMLINNAGLINDDFRLSEGIESTLMANHIGHKILTHLLLDKMNPKEARIINLSSIAHYFSNYNVNELKALQSNLEDCNGLKDKFSISLMFTQYGNTKLANVLFTKYLSENLTNKYPNIKVCSLHPGNVNTEFTKNMEKYNFLMKWIIKLGYPFYWYFTKTEIAGAQTTLTFCYDDFNSLENGVYLQDNKKSSLSSLARDLEVYDEFMKYSWMLVEKVTKGKIEIKPLK